ncbi:methyltransferase domain protein [Rhizoctonia solani]|uniref:Methyltransferase domain protein n=1 Tax=Rhizoctonia solani TaxID=456999 RepID=A0A8H8SUU8_9AGAM|nr:methyltransferase domain protein [Rhizoctonia solani]QRW19301.1 methyltransferase domain protein [Rhizoctonia solani]
MEESESTLIYFVEDNQDDDSDMASICTMTSELTEHTMSTLTSDLTTNYFREVNGRMFPIDRNVPFILPADARECQRLEAQHTALKLLLGANYFGPVKEVLSRAPNQPRKRVLDLFTGEGTWVREMAAEFPHVDFISVDTVPFVPHIRCANILSYEVYDLYNGIAEEDETFDIVHLRYAMLKSIACSPRVAQIKDLAELVLEIHRVLRPGGLFLYCEFENEEYDASVENHDASRTAPCLVRAMRISREELDRQGVYAYAYKDVPALLNPTCALWRNEEEPRGFTNITTEAKMCPVVCLLRSVEEPAVNVPYLWDE